MDYTVILALVLTSRIVSWGVTTFNADEWAFAAAAQEVLRGNLPYVTLFDIKPVGSSLLLAVVTRVMGTSPVALHAFGALCVLVASVLLYEAVLGWTGRRMEALAVGVLYASSTVLFSGLATMTEIMLAPFSCAGVVLLSRYVQSEGRAGLVTSCAAGLAFGIAVTLKTVPALSGTVLGGLALLAAWRRHGILARFVAHGAAYVAALAAPTTAAASIFALAGHWKEFAYANYGFMRVYMHADPASVTLFHVLVIAVEAWPLTLLIGLGLVRDASRLVRGAGIGSIAWAAYAWLACEVLAAVSSLRVTESYFLMALPPAAVLAARELAGLARNVAGEGLVGRRLLVGSAFILALVPVLPSIRNSAVMLLKYPNTEREVAKLVRAHQDDADRSMVALSFDLLPDVVTTGSTVPYRVAIPVHLFGAYTSLIGPDPVGIIQAMFATRPRLVLVDWVDLAHEATAAEGAAVRSALAADYGEVGEHIEDYGITGGGIYHRADIHLFQREEKQP